jgi:vacuolar-type H+-ATPase subunit F/Vma7
MTIGKAPAAAVEAIARPGVCAGFALAGVACHEADSGSRLEEVLERNHADEVAVLLVQSDLLDLLPDAFRKRLAKRALPLVVPFPAPATIEEPGAGEAYVSELLRRAIGYRVRLR